MYTVLFGAFSEFSIKISLRCFVAAVLIIGNHCTSCLKRFKNNTTQTVLIENQSLGMNKTDTETPGTNLPANHEQCFCVPVDLLKIMQK